MEKKKIHWAKQLLLNRKARERYHIKKYGNIKKLAKREQDLQDYLDEDAAKTEQKECSDI